MAPGRTQGVGRAVSRAGLQHDTGRSRKTALRAFQGRVKTPIRPQSGMFALIGPSRCGSGPSRSQWPQTIRRADGWPGVVCGGLASHCRRPSAGWQRLAPRLAQSWRPLLHRARADCPASSSSTSTPTGSQPSTSPAPTVCRSGHFGQMAGAVCVLGLQGHGGVNVAEGLADALALAARLPWRAVCMGGTAGFHNLELARWLAGSGTVHIWADQHAPGFAAAEILGRMVVGEANTTVSVEHVGVGEDPGAAGAPFAPLDAPTFEALAADLEREGLPAWEAARVASTITN